jgi:hypothetical protein
MKVKKEYIVLAVVVVALVVYLVSRSPDRNLYDLPQIEPVQAKEITRLELTMAKGGVMFTKEGSDWKISPENYAADPQKVKEMLAVVEGLTLTELISESKNYQRYDLDAKDSISLKCWDKEDLRFELLIGKSAGSFNHTFVKLPEDDAVYHAKGNFRNKFDMEKGEFREKSVLAFDKETIGAFEIRAKEIVETFKSVEDAASSTESAVSEAVEKIAAQNAGKEPQWMDSKGEEADANKIQTLISSLSNLKCEKFMEDKSKEDLSDPVYTITLTGAKEYTLSLYAEMEEDGESFFAAVSSENAYPFLLPQWQSENIMKMPKDLLKKSDQTEE